MEHSTAINMKEYVAAAKANLAWIAWRSEDFEKTEELAVDAIKIWQSLPVSSPFQDLAVWPLIGALLKENQVEEACRYAEILFQPAQHQLLSGIEKELKEALQACSSSKLDEAREKLIRITNAVVDEGYL